VLSPEVRVGPGAIVEGSVLCDRVVVGAGAVVRRAIIDKNVVIPPGARIGLDPEEDRARFETSAGGVVAIPKNHRFRD
jgi:glucose-1-phosphate adenylyltransferase